MAKAASKSNEQQQLLSPSQEFAKKILTGYLDAIGNTTGFRADVVGDAEVFPHLTLTNQPRTSLDKYGKNKIDHGLDTVFLKVHKLRGQKPTVLALLQDRGWGQTSFESYSELDHYQPLIVDNEDILKTLAQVK